MSSIFDWAEDELDRREALDTARHEEERLKGLPLITAVALLRLRGFEAVAGEVLPDGTRPVLERWRMTPEEWETYRAGCRQLGATESTESASPSMPCG